MHIQLFLFFHFYVFFLLLNGFSRNELKHNLLSSVDNISPMVHFRIPWRDTAGNRHENVRWWSPPGQTTISVQHFQPNL